MMHSSCKIIQHYFLQILFKSVEIWQFHRQTRGVTVFSRTHCTVHTKGHKMQHCRCTTAGLLCFMISKTANDTQIRIGWVACTYMDTSSWAAFNDTSISYSKLQTFPIIIHMEMRLHIMQRCK